MHRIAALAALLLAIASIPGCAYASWLVVTGGNYGWLFALLSLAVFVASVRLRGRVDPGATSYAGLALLAVPLAMALPLVHVGHYAHHGGPLALGTGAAIAVLVVIGLAVVTVLGILASAFKPWS
ncbi:MAG: hypothetical protein QOI11_960 [Candidatus Eremiobacteraeota bacterium]|jgi:hypothetical protein|nr:hypothetical protein [Candidatus Eremiobacteraeota bacterium]